MFCFTRYRRTENIFFKTNYHTFQEPVMNGATNAPISQVRMSAMFLLLIAGSGITFTQNCVKFDQMIQKSKGT
jgi:hypothetical protein